MRDWLSPGFLSTCKSGDNKLNGGVAGWNGVVVGKVHRRVCQTLKRAEDGVGVLEFPGTGCGGQNKTTIRWFSGIENTTKP